MRAECVLEPLCTTAISVDTLVITLLNTRSLQRHAIDIFGDWELLNTDVLCLTETQLQTEQDTNNISNVFKLFQLFT